MNNPFAAVDFDVQDMRGDHYTAKPPVTKILRMESLGYMALALALYSVLGFSWSQFAIWFLLPDIAILVYLFANPTLGAYAYNLTHSSLGAAVVGIAGVLAGSAVCSQISLIWFAHIGFDRALGYGLKYYVGFRVTHLGVLRGMRSEGSESLNK